MPLFLDTTGKSSLAVSICDRCKRKFPLVELYHDPNAPGLLVCKDDADQFDPWRLPARTPEDITLRFVRPDTPLVGNPSLILQENGEFILTTDDDNFIGLGGSE